jgi:hypothetical protein
VVSISRLKWKWLDETRRFVCCIDSKEIGLELQVVGLDVVGGNALIGLFKEMPKGGVIPRQSELEELNARSLVWVFGVLG